MPRLAPTPRPRLAARFAADRRGVVAVIFSLALAPLAMAAGAAVNYAQGNDDRAALQRAADAAALAAALSARDRRGEPDKVATATFDAAYRRSDSTVAASAVHSLPAPRIHRVTAQADVPIRMAGLLGRSSMRITAVAEATFGAPRAEPAEIAIVMDTTSSMAFGGEWPEAVRAVGTMLQTLKGDGSQPYFVTLVPMSDRVNVSSIHNASTSWMKDKAPDGWNGCLEPRERAQPGFAHALDDDRPTANADKFSPSAPGSFIANHTGATYGPGGAPFCPRQAITGPTNDVAVIETAMQGLQTGGTGRPDEGMAWGWRVLSERWQGQWKAGEGYPSKNGTRRKIAILVTDGQTTAYDFEVGGSAGGSFGWNRGTRAGFEHLVGVCNRMKAQGIEIHVLQINDNTAFTDYARLCASAPENHYRARTVEAFKAAFQRIGGRGENVRLIH